MYAFKRDTIIYIALQNTNLTLWHKIYLTINSGQKDHSQKYLALVSTKQYHQMV
jgi:hypothetical protein